MNRNTPFIRRRYPQSVLMRDARAEYVHGLMKEKQAIFIRLMQFAECMSVGMHLTAEESNFREVITAYSEGIEMKIYQAMNL